MELLGKGRQAEVYAINEQECVKLFYEDCPLSLVEHEAKIMQYISTLPISSPKFLGLTKQDHRYGIRMERIFGRSMLEEMFCYPEKLEFYGENMGRMQFKFHQIKAEKCQSMTNQMTWAINATTLLTDEEKGRLLKHLNDMPVEDKLIHTDYHVDNLMITAKGIMIIDWSGALCGHPLADVARTLLSCSAGSYPIDASPKMCAVIDEFRSKLKESYLKGYGIKEEELSEWKPLVAASRLFVAPKEEQAVDLEIVKEYLARA